jgi:hypothetical protein
MITYLRKEDDVTLGVDAFPRDQSGLGIALQLLPDFQQVRELSVLIYPSSVIFILTPPQRRKVGMSVAIYSLEFDTSF